MKKPRQKNSRRGNELHFRARGEARPGKSLQESEGLGSQRKSGHPHSDQKGEQVKGTGQENIENRPGGALGRWKRKKGGG